MIMHFITKFIQRTFREGVPSYAAQIAYYMILAIFPFITFVAMILTGTHLVTSSMIINAIEPIHTIPEAVKDMIVSVFNSLEKDSSSYFSIYLVLILYASSRATSSIANGIHRVYHTFETRNIFVRALLSIFYTIAFAVLIVLLVVLVLFGEAISKAAFNFLGLSQYYETTVTYLRYSFPAFLMFITYLLLYRFIPTRRVKFRFVWPGALFASAISVIVSGIFSFSFSDISRYQSLYGSVSQIIIIIIWLWLISLVLLLGAVFNAVLIDFNS